MRALLTLCLATALFCPTALGDSTATVVPGNRVLGDLADGETGV